MQLNHLLTFEYLIWVDSDIYACIYFATMNFFPWRLFLIISGDNFDEVSKTSIFLGVVFIQNF